MRRTHIYAVGIVTGAALMLSGGVFAFLAQVLHPVFWAFVVATVTGIGGLIWWAIRDLRRTDYAMARIEDTVLLDLEAIAAYRPPAATRHPMDASLWRRMRGRARQAKEAAR